MCEKLSVLEREREREREERRERERGERERERESVCVCLCVCVRARAMVCVCVCIESCMKRKSTIHAYAYTKSISLAQRLQSTTFSCPHRHIFKHQYRSLCLPAQRLTARPNQLSRSFKVPCYFFMAPWQTKLSGSNPSKTRRQRQFWFIAMSASSSCVVLL